MSKKFRVKASQFKYSVKPRRDFKALRLYAQELQRLRKIKDQSSAAQREIRTIRGFLNKTKYIFELTHIPTGEVYKSNLSSGYNDRDRFLEYLKLKCKLLSQRINNKRQHNRKLEPNNYDFYGVKVTKYGGVFHDKGMVLKAKKESPLEDPWHNPVPWSCQNFIGIELEFNYALKRNGGTTEQQNAISDVLKKYKLGKYCNITRDHCGHEIRVLVPEKIFESKLREIISALKEAGCGGDERCGAHVHLDMRNRDVKRSYKNLVKIQDAMFKLVAQRRRNNEFCRKNEYDSYDKYKNHDVEGFTQHRGGTLSRYRYVNAASYDKHKTLEIRLHHGTLDADEIINWIKLLLKTIDRSEEINENVTKVGELAKTIKLKGQDLKYLKTRYLKYRSA